MPDHQPVDRGVCVLRIERLADIGVLRHGYFVAEPSTAAVIDDDVARDGEEPGPWRPIAFFGDLGVTSRVYQSFLHYVMC
jgi:hypothetical protein